METKALKLSVLTSLVLVAMLLPWALFSAVVYSVQDDGQIIEVFRPRFGLYALGAPVGHLFTSLSFALASAALVLTLFFSRHTAFRVACGVLLLLSAVACVCDGVRGGFDCFTVLTWCILAALTALGAWTLFFMKKDA